MRRAGQQGINSSPESDKRSQSWVRRWHALSLRFAVPYIHQLPEGRIGGPSSGTQLLTKAQRVPLVALRSWRGAYVPGAWCLCSSCHAYLYHVFRQSCTLILRTMNVTESSTIAGSIPACEVCCRVCILMYLVCAMYVRTYFADSDEFRHI